MPRPSAGLVHVSFPLPGNLFRLTLCGPISFSPFRSRLNAHLLRDVLRDFSRKASPLATDTLCHVSFRALTPIAIYSLTGVFVCGLFPYPPSKVNTYEVQSHVCLTCYYALDSQLGVWHFAGVQYIFLTE